MSELMIKQQWFTILSATFIVWCYKEGYIVTYGEVFRSDEQAEINALGPSGRAQLVEILNSAQYSRLAHAIDNNTGSGIRNSLHGKRLAMDLNLFINGVYQTKTEAYAPLGKEWKSMHRLARWGGDFASPDGNHFSLEHEGIK